MAELVKQAIDTVFEIKDVVLKFKRNNEECARICETVETLIEDLSVLQETSKLWHPSVRAAMQRLNNTLVETERKVKGCQNINAVYRIFFLTGHIASKLDKLRKDIHEKMLSALLLTSMSTISGMQNNARQDDIESLRQEMRQDRRERRKDVAALKHLLGISDNACNENRTREAVADGATTGLRQYSRWSDLVAAANNSISIIHERKGSSTSIYKAKLDNELVAIKKFHKMSEQVKARFLHELRLLQKLQHRNVVELLGFCFEYNESLVVEDNDVQVASNGVLGFMSRFMSKKSMAEVIIKGNEHVVWPSLFRIIQGIAKGIRYLHRQNVVHLDLRPENILLDTDDMTPKINNFGKAQQLKDGHSSITLDKKHLPGDGKYVAPELLAGKSWIKFFLDKVGLSGYEASTKSDVYSFGVILLEIIGRMCATSKNGRRPRRPEDWAKRMEESELVDLFDPNRINGDTRRMAARWCVIVGLLCCVPDPQERPSMSEVIAMLGSYVQEEEETNNREARTTSSYQGKGKTIMASSSSSSSSSSVYRSQDSKRCTSVVRNKELVGYKVLSNVMLHEQQDEDTRKVTDVLKSTPGVAELLLRHYKWLHQDVLFEWFNNNETVCNVAGLPREVPPMTITMMKVSTELLKCLKCKKRFNSGEMWSAECSHYYCKFCWGDHIGNADSARIVCLKPSCKAPVVRELVEAVAGDQLKAQYDLLVGLSYVNDSGGRRKWCCGCNTRAVELLDDGASSSTTTMTTKDVLCECKHRFCWNCSKQPHQPWPCTDQN
ncbi:hypothetical protein SETIT_8G217300v2 [Setaria italica]|uniref:Protein kinase domain-containing protein n=1 Tax=Setaria italica TaxID=4555 RepID=A0A368SA99_SETIT|nr:hypothetical protein SETIT_8G217300v2 [Setaria italica]